MGRFVAGLSLLLAILLLAGCFSRGYRISADVETESQVMGPILFGGWFIDLNSIGQPMAKVILGNLTEDKTIQAAEFRLYCYDSWGEPVNHYIADHGSTLLVEAQEAVILPMEFDFVGPWTLHGRESTRALGVHVVRVLYTDGTIWENPTKPPATKPVWQPYTPSTY